MATEAVIVGGGAVGLGIAWRAAAAGLAVTVVDEAPGRGASWAAAGMLAPVTEVHYGEQALLALNLASAALYPQFVAELEEVTGTDVGYRRCGTLLVARDADDNAALADLHAFQLGMGLEVERLGSRDCRQLEPALSPRVRGGILVPGDHQVDNRALVIALAAACRAAGAELCSGRARAVHSSRDRVDAVELTDGRRLPCAQVVLAAGCWSGSVAGVPAAAVPPVRPVKGQLLHLRGPAVPPLLAHNVRGIDVYLVPRADGRLVVGASVEDRGFDTTVTAGGVHALLHAAEELLPGVAELEVRETVAGLRPGSPDNAPLLGPAGPPAPAGLVVATGHHRNGILLAPVTAQAIADLLASGVVPPVVAPFSPGRFRAAHREAS